MKSQGFSDRYLMWATLVIAALALIVSIMTILGFDRYFAPAPATGGEAASASPAAQQGGPARHGGPGMMMMPPQQGNSAVAEVLDRRLDLLRTALTETQQACQAKKSTLADVWRARVALDEAIVLKMRAGGRRMMPGASEALLKYRLAAALEKENEKAFKNGTLAPSRWTACRLAANQAELEFRQALQRVRGGREAFEEAAKAFSDYPAEPADEAKLKALFAAETMR